MVCQLIQDHPRRCGENKEAQAIKVLCTGSPPQVRGKRSNQIKIKIKLRITPAGAGKTVPKDSAYLCMQDHPRRCGENFGKAVNVNVWIGSPPQVRGKRKCRHSRRFAVMDHPRRCGENFLSHLFCWLCQGSPPQVRGKREAQNLQPRKLRITPAGAGKTLQRKKRIKFDEDHPRRCGEN